MIFKIRVSIFIVTLLFATNSYSQYAYSLNYFGGRMTPHSTYTKSLAAPIVGIQTDVVWRMRRETDDLGSRKNSNLKFFPQIGGSLTWMDMGMNVTGYQLAVSLNLGGEISAKGPWSFDWHFAHGLTYLSEKYDTLTRPINYAIGSNLNYFAQIKGEIKYDITPNLALSLGGYLTHASNGNLEKPNVGLNVIHYGIGMLYVPNESQNSDRSSYYIHKKHYFTTPYSLGVKFGNRSHSLEFPESFTSWIFDFQFRFQKSAHHIWDVGFDLFSDPNYKFTKTGRYTGADELDQLEFAIKGGHQFVYGRIGLRTDLGIYVFRPVSSDKGAFYNAIGIDYRLTQNWVLRSRLKAHLNVADYMEFGMSRLF